MAIAQFHPRGSFRADVRYRGRANIGRRGMLRLPKSASGMSRSPPIATRLSA
jgi:hypothetical protein